MNGAIHFRPIRVCRLVAVDGVEELAKSLGHEEALIPPLLFYNLAATLDTRNKR
jgi:hypothetical protein